MFHLPINIPQVHRCELRTFGLGFHDTFSGQEDGEVSQSPITFHQCNAVTSAGRQQGQVCVGRDSSAKAGAHAFSSAKHLYHPVGTWGRLWALLSSGWWQMRQPEAMALGMPSPLHGSGGKKFPLPHWALRGQDSRATREVLLPVLVWERSWKPYLLAGRAKRDRGSGLRECPSLRQWTQPAP